MDPELWKPENYLHFLKARRELLAQAGNEFLDSLFSGAIPEEQEMGDITTRRAPVFIGGIENGEEKSLQDCNEWVKTNNLPGGEFSYELLADEVNQVFIIVDLAWPDGLQEGYSQPVALILNEDAKMEQYLNALGYRFFTTIADFREYVLREILADSTDME